MREASVATMASSNTVKILKLILRFILFAFPWPFNRRLEGDYRDPYRLIERVGREGWKDEDKKDSQHSVSERSYKVPIQYS